MKHSTSLIGINDSARCVVYKGKTDKAVKSLLRSL